MIKKTDWIFKISVIGIMLIFCGLLVYATDITTYTIFLGTENRQLVSTDSVNTTVCTTGCDYSTIQAAVDDIPFILRHDYTINIFDGTYDENISVKNIFSQSTDFLSDDAIAGVVFKGNASDASGVRISSIYFDGCQGGYFRVTDLTIFGNVSYNEAVGIGAFWSAEVVVKNITFESTVGNGIISYGGNSYVHLNSNIIFNGQTNAIWTKHGGSIGSENTVSLQGTSTNQAVNTGGYIAIANTNSLTGTSVANRGFIYEFDNGKLSGEIYTVEDFRALKTVRIDDTNTGGGAGVCDIQLDSSNRLCCAGQCA